MKTFIIEVSVPDKVYEELFETALKRGLVEGDIHFLSYLNNMVKEAKIISSGEPIKHL